MLLKNHVQPDRNQQCCPKNRPGSDASQIELVLINNQQKSNRKNARSDFLFAQPLNQSSPEEQRSDNLPKT